MADKRDTTIVEDGLETIEGARQFLRLSRSAIYQLMESGELPFVKLGKARRIPRKALVDLANRCLCGRDGGV
jgi:excisionase family DNA binding protein